MNSERSLNDICEKLGLQPQFLLNLAENAHRFYITFDRPKKSGGVRTISASQDSLKRIQRVLLDGLLSEKNLPSHVHGCVKGRSVVSNAEVHVNKELVINLDISKFFPSITFEMIERIFEDTYNCDPETSELLTRLTTLDGSLPQGAPTSPYLANIASLEMDNQLMRICDEQVGRGNYHYTRYVDDITISGSNRLIDLSDQFHSIVSAFGFKVNPEKTKFLRKSMRQKVTGMIVNEKVSIPKKLQRKLRQQLYFCEKYGVQDHCDRSGVSRQQFLRELRGLVSYLGMTKPDSAFEYRARLGKELQITQKLDDIQEKYYLLSRMIEGSKVAEFQYGRESCKAAPSSLEIDDDGVALVRAFQISPTQRWKKFRLEYMSSLQLVNEQQS